MRMRQELPPGIEQIRPSEVEKKLLFSKIKKLEELPLPSYSLLKITGILRSGTESTKELIECIENDHVLTAQVFRLIYNKHPLHASSITSTHAAVAHLHGEELKELATYPRMLDHFGAEEEFEWSHASSSAALMARIIEDNELDDMHYLILAAQLHDIGKIVLRDWSPKKYHLVRNHVDLSVSVPFYRMENAILQTNHAEVGSALLKAWGFPEKITKVVLQHHSENVPDEFVFETALLQFVNWIDTTARGIECIAPSKDLLFAAGIDEIDADGCKLAQRQYLARIDSVHNAAQSPAHPLTIEERSKAITEMRNADPEVFEGILDKERLSEQYELMHAKEDEEPVNTFDPAGYVINDVPYFVAEREAEILKEIDKKH